MKRPVAAHAKVSRRHRVKPRHLLAGLLGVWVALVCLVPLAGALPPAIKAGTVVRRLHGELAVLGSGWTKTIGFTSSGRNGTGDAAWEWSIGARSTIRLQPGDDGVKLDLDPSACSDRKPQRLTLQSPGAGNRTLVLSPGFHWYVIDLGTLRAPGQLALTYRCVAPTTPPRGDLPRGPRGVAIAGLVVLHSG